MNGKLDIKKEVEMIKEAAQKFLENPEAAKKFIDDIHARVFGTDHTDAAEDTNSGFANDDLMEWAETPVTKEEIEQRHETATASLDWMKSKAKIMGVYDAAKVVLEDPLFFYCSGCCVASYDAPKRHHYGTYGLVQHTHEILQSGMILIDSVYKRHNINKTEFFLAAVFHDYGKTFDYSLKTVFHENKKHKYWAGTEHKRLVHHISRSGVEWMKASENLTHDKRNQYEIPVYHAILAHHGQRQYGSPVMPYTKVAYLLHTCDMMSARLDDCSRVDYVNVRGD